MNVYDSHQEKKEKEEKGKGERGEDQKKSTPDHHASSLSDIIEKGGGRKKEKTWECHKNSFYTQEGRKGKRKGRRKEGTWVLQLEFSILFFQLPQKKGEKKKKGKKRKHNSHFTSIQSTYIGKGGGGGE